MLLPKHIELVILVSVGRDIISCILKFPSGLCRRCSATCQWGKVVVWGRRVRGRAGERRVYICESDKETSVHRFFENDYKESDSDTETETIRRRH